MILVQLRCSFKVQCPKSLDSLKRIETNICTGNCIVNINGDSPSTKPWLAARLRYQQLVHRLLLRVLAS